MISLILALGQASPIQVPTESVTPLNDRLVSALGRGERMRGNLVSEDGKAVFANRFDGFSVLQVRGSRISQPEYYLRRSEKAVHLYDSSERYELERKGTKPEEFENAGIVSLVRAEDEEHVTFAFSDHDKRFGLATVQWIGSGKDGTAIDFVPKAGQGFMQAWPDVSSKQPYFALYGLGDHQSVGYGQPASAEIIESKPGFQPVLFDSAHKQFLGYHYSESGFPSGLAIKPMGKGEVVELPGVHDLNIMAITWTPGGKLLAYFDKRYEDDRSDSSPGTYLLEGTTWKKVGDVSIEGQSASGHYLLLSDLKERKSWIVGLKS